MYMSKIIPVWNQCYEGNKQGLMEKNGGTTMDQVVQAGFSEEVPLMLRLKGWDWTHGEWDLRNGIPKGRNRAFRGPAAAESLYIFCVCDIKTQKESRVHLASSWLGWPLPCDKGEWVSFGTCSGTLLSGSWDSPFSRGHPSSVVLWLEPQRTQLSHGTPFRREGSLCILSAAAAAKSLQSCPTLCDPIDGSPPGSAVPGILQARTLEWVAISFSNAWKWSRSVVSDS